MSNKKRPLLIIPPQYESFEAMFESQEYKDHVEQTRIKSLTDNTFLERMLFPSGDRISVLIGKSIYGPSMLEEFILKNGGQKIS